MRAKRLTLQQRREIFHALVTTQDMVPNVPRSRQIVGQILAEVPRDDITKIVSTNCAKLYRFDVPAE